MDDRGITHILPANKVERKYTENDLTKIQQETRREIEEKMARTEIKIPGEEMRIERPRDSSPLAGETVRSQKYFEQAAIDAVHRGAHKGRTFG